MDIVAESVSHEISVFRLILPKIALLFSFSVTLVRQYWISVQMSSSLMPKNDKVLTEMHEFVAPVSTKRGRLCEGRLLSGIVALRKIRGPWGIASGLGRDNFTWLV